MNIAARLGAPCDGASIAAFRAAFGAILAFEIARELILGGVARRFESPRFFLPFAGFAWLRPWPAPGMRIEFAALFILALGLVVGFRPRLCAALCALGSAHIFLIDEVEYLNHHYLMILLAALLAVIPSKPDVAPTWALVLLRSQVALPYIFGGIAKLDRDWLAGAPLRIWLTGPAARLPGGALLSHPSAPIALAWGGLIFDLAVVPLLLWRRTRTFAIAASLAFHITNAWLFDIGVFPWLMLAATSLFLEPDWPRRVGLLSPAPPAAAPVSLPSASLRAALLLHLTLQLITPLRHLAIPGDVAWTEEGHTCSWRMKLRDKEVKLAALRLVDAATGAERAIDPNEYLTERQLGKTLVRPQLLRRFARLVADEEERRGRPRPRVQARVLIALNGGSPVLLVDPGVDLAAEALAPGWILPRPGAGP